MTVFFHTIIGRMALYFLDDRNNQWKGLSGDRDKM